MRQVEAERRGRAIESLTTQEYYASQALVIARTPAVYELLRGPEAVVFWR